MTTARTQNELKQLREELEAISERNEEARQRRAERRDATIARYRAIGDSIQRHAKHASPLLLLAAFGLGFLVCRHLGDKKGAR